MVTEKVEKAEKFGVNWSLSAQINEKEGEKYIGIYLHAYHENTDA